MLGRETFIVRAAEDAMAPRVRVGDYVWVDPDKPAAEGLLIAVRDPGRGGKPSSGSSSSATGAASCTRSMAAALCAPSTSATRPTSGAWWARRANFCSAAIRGKSMSCAISSGSIVWIGEGEEIHL